MIAEKLHKNNIVYIRYSDTFNTVQMSDIYSQLSNNGIILDAIILNKHKYVFTNELNMYFISL